MTIRRLIRLLYPMRCPQCGNLVPFDEDYCDCYKNHILPTKKLCCHCGQNEDECTCSYHGTIKLSNFTSPFFYDGLIRAKLHNLKFNLDKSEAKFFAPKMAERFLSDFNNAQIDAICFVPMTKCAQEKRGFNQSLLLAKGISKVLNVPVLDALKKQFETTVQHTLTAKERKDNLLGSFGLNCDVGGKTLLLVDDIKTTGATLQACENVLLLNGTKKVFCVTAATTKFQPDLF